MRERARLQLRRLADRRHHGLWRTGCFPTSELRVVRGGANVSGIPDDQMSACTENMERKERDSAEGDKAKRLILKKIEEEEMEVKDLINLGGGNR